MLLLGLITPSSKPISAAKGLKVDPGGYWPLMARLYNGLLTSSNSLERLLCFNGPVRSLGSKPGPDAIAIIPPVLGSSATIAPTLLANSFSANCCNSISR